MPDNETVLIGSKDDVWSPTFGDATAALGAYLVDEKHELPDQAAFNTIVASSLDIVKRCKPFNAVDGSKTGLVVGYVQSGKTMSMTTVASLARDSGCRLVILLAGVTEILLKQSARKRLKPYLLNKPDQRSGWLLIDTVDSVQLKKDHRERFKQSVDLWRNSSIAENKKRPIFISVMKNHHHLSHLTELLKTADLHGIPTLILDDEADQASLDNNAARRAAGKIDEASTTHERIAQLRQALPNHTYLQYTATAQAPLLISVENILSPDFACVLEPGKSYTGGKAFFLEQKGLVKPLPTDDVVEDESAPPELLYQAMLEFYVGVAIGLLEEDKGKRSMLVHPSGRMNDHDVFMAHVRKVKAQWDKDLNGAETRADVLEEFEEAFKRLKTTAPSLPPWELVADELPFALSETQLWKVNSEDGAEVDWDMAYGHLLVGGDKLNRGYTVEGLTVTYMPRSAGAWNADTIQQRARFFGYKAKYLGLCRIYLHPDVLQAYRDYVHHEEHVRSQLKKHQGKPLKEWRRAFFLDHRMHPTRASVLSDPIHRVEIEGWFRQRAPHHAPTDVALAQNRATTAQLRQLCDAAGWTPFASATQHEVAELPLKTVYDTFIADYQCFDVDAESWLGIALVVGELLSKVPDAQCAIVSMGKGERRRRGQDARHNIAQLFEGRRPKTGTPTYGGDEVVRDPTFVTLQLHTLDVTAQKAKATDKPLMQNVPAIALHFPHSGESLDYVVQGGTT